MMPANWRDFSYVLSAYFKKAPITREYEDLGHEITGSHMAKLPRGMAKKRTIKIMRTQSEKFLFILNTFKVDPAAPQR